MWMVRAAASAVFLALIGYLAGYCAPLALNPDASLGPLLGLFVTGPLGFAVGLLFGIVCAVRRTSLKRYVLSLFALSLAFALVVLYLSLPEERWQGFVIDAEVRRCEPANGFVAAAQERWERINAQTSWEKPRAKWQQEIPAMLQRDTGSVVSMRVIQRWDVFEERHPWNRGKLRVTHSRRPTESSYFARGQDCTSPQLAPGYRSTYAPEWEASQVSPPDSLPAFLGLEVLRKVPPSFEAAIASD